jgi:hypothetical protein
MKSMQPSPSDSNDPHEVNADPEKAAADSPNCTQSPVPATNTFWGKTKQSLGEASKHASKVASLSTAVAAKVAGAASDATLGAVETGKQAYSGSKLESTVNFIDGELDQRGAKKAIQETTQAVVGKLDQVTGKRLVELLEEKLKLQDVYNDILATRLAEALDRIAKLEARFYDD